MAQTSKFVKSVAFTGFAASIIIAPNPADAVVISIEGINYDVTTVEGTFNEFYPQLKATPWWGKPEKSALFAEKVGNSLDIQILDGRPVGPLFAKSETIPDPLNPDLYPFLFISIDYFQPAAMGAYPSRLYSSNTFSTMTHTWAVASIPTTVFPTDPGTVVVPPVAVPEPLTILGTVTAIGFCANFERRLAKAKKNNKDV